jgi:hypothetical protein
VGAIEKNTNLATVNGFVLEYAFRGTELEHKSTATRNYWLPGRH